MRKIGFIMMILAAGVYMTSCGPKETTNDQEEFDMDNILLSDFDTPFGVPPFDKISEDDYVPAYKAAMHLHQEEVTAIIENTEEPTFENTIEAMEFSGKKLTQVRHIFDNLNLAVTNEKMQSIAKEVAPLVSAHYDDIYLNDALFAKVKAVYDKKEELALEGEKAMLLEEAYKGFVRKGALVEASSKDRFREINSKLSTLTLQFDENLLAETNAYKLVVDNEEDLSGLPQDKKDAAATAAEANKMTGKWVFTLAKPSLIPFLTYADNRELRKQMHTAYIMRGDNENEFDNKEIAREMANLRIEKANLLGFKTHADYILDNNMAKTPQNVYDLMIQLWEPAIAQAKIERDELQKFAEDMGHEIEIEHYDWWYYTEKMRKQRYDLDESQISEYLSLENVKQGAFLAAQKLWGLQFELNTEVPVYHPDAMCYNVKEANGDMIGLLYMDFHPRASKGSGAWMEAYRKQHVKDGKNILPIITNVCNFTEPTKDKPALLTFDEATTLFHEFGHALHGLLSKCNYYSLGGTSVARDFVELPSQIMENWAGEPEFMKVYAKHYKTGEAIPDELIAKMDAASKFNQGFAVSEFVAAAYLDMFWHTLDAPMTGDVREFETSKLKELGLIDEIIVRYRSTFFGHIFAGGYSSGYYGYSWAEVLDADAFEAFKENGIFDQETASKFREFVLSKGGTENAMDLYKQFRGRAPKTEAMLKRKGFIAAE